MSGGDKSKQAQIDKLFGGDEAKWLAWMKSIASKGGKVKPSEEARQKMAQAKIGHSPTPETRAKLSQARKAYWEHRREKANSIKP